MQLRLFLLLILFLTTTSFFWDDDERQLRQMHQSAETAMQKGDFQVAKEAFKEVLKRIAANSANKPRLDWTGYIDASLRLASCCFELNEPDEASDILEGLLAKTPPAEFLPKIKLTKARLSSTPKAAAEAFIDLQSSIAKYPIEVWSGKELTFYHALENSLNDYYEELLAKGKRFLVSGFYKEAISAYEEVLRAILRGAYPKFKTENSFVIKKIRYRLAQSYYLAADYEKTLDVCESNSLTDALDKEMLFLTALCHREKHEYEKALNLFESYTELGDHDREHYQQALFEIGLYYYQRGGQTKAYSYFERLLPSDGKMGLLATLYLARIELNSGRAKEAEALLSSVKIPGENHDPLHYECYYLKGLAAYQRGEYQKAKDLFERSLPDAKYVWKENSYYHLGWCCLQLGGDLSKTENQRLQLFDLAQKCFKYISSHELKEAATLSLADLYLLQFRFFNHLESLKLLKELFLANFSQFSLEGQVKALLLLAEGTMNLSEKTQLYERATSLKYLETESYFQAWYCKGLHDFQQGLKSPEELHFFESAAVAFAKAFDKIALSDKFQAANILKLEAKANFYNNAPMASLELLERLLLEFEETIEQREETLYLRGLLASKVKDLSYFSIAEDSLNEVLQKYPTGKFREESLYALGNFYFEREIYHKALECFRELAENPRALHAPEALFWAAEASSALGEEASFYRKRLFDNYPSSEWAPEAYFRVFPYGNYLAKDTDAMAHLKNFPSLFPHSPFIIGAYYLMGLNENSAAEKKKLFYLGLKKFTEYAPEALRGVEPHFLYFRYQMILALAELLLESQEENSLIECEELLTTLIQDFSQNEKSYNTLPRHERGYHPLHEEGEFKLARCYLKRGRDFTAQKMLKQMLHHYEEAGITESEYLPQVWKAQGKLAMRCQDYETALNCFAIAHEYGKLFFCEDQKLSLWLLQSECFRKKKEYNTAMRLLSKVINTQSTSPLRLKAMYLRSELYELKGRPDLAIRQLEAASKKGGEWGERAQAKLKVKYGLE